MKVPHIIAGGAASVALAVSGATASAAPIETPPNSSTSSEEPTSEEELDQFAGDLETLFTRYVQQRADGTVVVNIQNITADGMGDKISDFQRFADAMNNVGRTPSGQESQFSSNGASALSVGSFISCLATSALGIPIGNAPNLYAALREGLRAWNWGLTARTVARIIGPSATKALGGPWGIALALGWGALTCRGHL
ncbi:hypothetical protein [Actinomyces sp. zg328]|uniref:hypothetical protein n=1 Tax=Actinomyces sp. zg328 TaxID=2609287 RepID=UPI001359BC59|nr:hypothetical protein [Actinomyces sp. zg328]